MSEPILSRGYGDAAETRGKLGRLREALNKAELDAVYLEGWANVAWLCGGRSNRVILDSPAGQCGVLVSAGGAWLLAPNNEESRCRAEVFADLPLPVVVQPWYHLPLWQAVPALLPGRARWGADQPVPGAADAAAVLAAVRAPLDGAEIARYRALGEDAAEALEVAVESVEAGWTELELAAGIGAALKAREIEAPVLLVGTRERAERFRHLVPTQAPLQGGLIASVTAVRHGLHASLTRSASFGPQPGRLRERHLAAVAVDTAYLRASLPGATLGDILTSGEAAYEEAGYYDDWKEHHQGGTTGYAGRETVAVPGSEVTLRAGDAVAWNPTVPGAKSEDTYLVGGDGVEILTRAPATAWPSVLADGAPPELGRPGVIAL